MKIRFERSGGFAGMTQRAELDTEQMDPQVHQELVSLIESSNFFEQKINPTSPGQAGADRFHYSIAIEHGQQARAVEIDEADIPPEWQPLIGRINALARSTRG